MLVLIPFNVFTFFASPFLFFPFFPILFRFSIYWNWQHIGPRYVHGNARAEYVSVWIWRTLQWMRWILCSSNSEMPSKMCHLHTHINPRKIERKIIHAQHVIIMEKKGIKRFCAKKHEQRAYNFISLDEFLRRNEMRLSGWLIILDEFYWSILLLLLPKSHVFLQFSSQ